MTRSDATDDVELCAPGVYRLRTMIANLFFVADPAGAWTLVDAGMPGSAAAIRRTARNLFQSTPPSAVVLTHGHFDHVGGLPTLAEEWGVPIYAHPLEMPYLNGRSPYPPPDPSVGGGLMARLSPMFPRGPYNLGERLRMLPQDHTVPTLPQWRWIATPGHTPGHVSLFREGDRVLIAGDAVVTTRQESLGDVLVQRELVWRPPAYYTSDWASARRSVERIAELEPEVLATGHGHTMRGAAMRQQLGHLARNFEHFKPPRGRYIDAPALADERGVISIPPQRDTGRAAVAIGIAAAVAGATLMAAARARHSSRPGEADLS